MRFKRVQEERSTDKGQTLIMSGHCFFQACISRGTRCCPTSGMTLRKRRLLSSAVVLNPREHRRAETPQKRPTCSSAPKSASSEGLPLMLVNCVVSLIAYI